MMMNSISSDVVAYKAFIRKYPPPPPWGRVARLSGVWFLGIFVLNRVSILSLWVKCLKQGIKTEWFLFKQGQGLSDKATPPRPRIYQVPPRPGVLAAHSRGDRNTHSFFVLVGNQVKLQPDRPLGTSMQTYSYNLLIITSLNWLSVLPLDLFFS